ncbi:hypothetical protein ACX80D_12880 [Arthrobacter sp. Sr24]
MAGDLENIHHASGVTLQANSVACSETNLVDFDARGASLKVGGGAETSINAATFHKSPFDANDQSITGEIHVRS